VSSTSLAPPERHTIPVEESKRPLGLLDRNDGPEYGQQLSSFSALKQGKKTGTLFTVNESPLKTG